MSVHFDKDSMEKIVSLKDVEHLSGVGVHMDTDIKREIKVCYKGKW